MRRHPLGFSTCFYTPPSPRTTPSLCVPTASARKTPMLPTPPPVSAQHLPLPDTPILRIALVGLGQRGLKTLNRYAFIPEASIDIVADIDPARVEQANALLRQTNRPQARTYTGPDAWRMACQDADIDLVYICTQWNSHCTIAVEAMRHGKHVAVEVPAATSIEECWLLVRTAEETGRHCFMTENCCYDFCALATLEMHRRGLLGTITHCEGAYIHNLTVPSTHYPGGTTDTRQNWIEHACQQHGGNPYPTHAIGPIAQLLGIGRDDRMLSLVSVTAQGVTQGNQTLGRVNNTLITTQRGVSILLQLDVTTPRPYNRLQTVCGTQGFVQKYPLPCIQLQGHEPITGEEAVNEMLRYATNEAGKAWHKGHAMGVPNEMNYAMDARLVHCLTHGLAPEISVYDAAEWSCLAELTRQSALQGGIPVEIPDFRKQASR